MPYPASKKLDRYAKQELSRLIANDFPKTNNLDYACYQSIIYQILDVVLNCCFKQNKNQPNNYYLANIKTAFNALAAIKLQFKKALIAHTPKAKLKRDFLLQACNIRFFQAVDALKPAQLQTYHQCIAEHYPPQMPG